MRKQLAVQFSVSHETEYRYGVPVSEMYFGDLAPSSREAVSDLSHGRRPWSGSM